MLLLMCHVPLVAQSPQLFTSSEGLSCSQIESLMQDSKGYIWISTSYGLSRFDGVQFDTFYHDDNDSLSLAGNKVKKAHASVFWACSTDWAHWAYQCCWAPFPGIIHSKPCVILLSPALFTPSCDSQYGQHDIPGVIACGKAALIP